MNKVFALLSGLVFGIGLVISGMANPEKVLSFLSITNDWDPSLAFVMIGAISVSIIGFMMAKKRRVSYLNQTIILPTQTRIDNKLVLGAVLFGLGWGIAGICPGPGLVLISLGEIKGSIFMAAMLLGMMLFELVASKIKS
ncbi:DUF6691 family protein [Thorsellia kenyensis]|uniref:DUF6691 family protein n=1 Tax=Thorsellia kenyensis TaxID=1549888 RepID=A0ABV6CBE9_9GAMM